MKLTEDQIRLLAELEVAKDIKRKYIQEHKIYFIGNKDPELDKDFPELKLKGLNPKQQVIIDNWGNPDYEIFTFTGGNRMGKTFIATAIAICVMAGEWLIFRGSDEKKVLPKIKFNHNYPRKVRYVGQDWEEHIKTVVEPAMKELWPKDRPVKLKKNNQGINASWVDVKTGSELIIMSNKQDAGTHEGWFGDLCVFDEPPKRDIWIANSRGLTDREGRAFFSMTLLKEAWVHREVIKRMDERGRPDNTVFNVTGEIYDNIGYGLTEKGVEQFARTLKPDEKEARLLGKPSYLSGLIFPKFDRQIHVKEPLKSVPLDWIVDVAIDWHPSKGWACQMVSTDRINRKWVIWEMFVKANYKWIAEELVRVIRKHDMRVEDPFLIDPLAKSGSQSDEHEETVFDKLDEELMQYGYSLEPASKKQNDGIEIINEYLITETDEPALFVTRECPITIQHMEDWMWKDGKPAEEGEDMCENLYRIMLRNTQYYRPRQHGSEQEVRNWKMA